MDKVDVTESCWLWKGARVQCKGHSTYGKYDSVLAHRMSYEIFIGPIPSKSHVCHKCDNMICVNPAHLFIGDPLINARDRNSKGRQARGERMNTHKLTEAQVRDIRKMYSNGETLTKLSKSFSVSQPNIWYIVNRKTWAWIND